MGYVNKLENEYECLSKEKKQRKNPSNDSNG